MVGRIAAVTNHKGDVQRTSRASRGVSLSKSRLGLLLVLLVGGVSLEIVGRGRALRSWWTTTMTTSSSRPLETTREATTNTTQSVPRRPTTPTALVAAHVRRRPAEGGPWISQREEEALTTSKKADEERLSASSVARIVVPQSSTTARDGNNGNDTITHPSFVALVRITKSGSTALLQRLRSNPTFHRSLDLDAYYRHVSGGSRLSTRGLLPACVLGIQTAPQDSHISSQLPRMNQSDHDFTSQCPHTGYRNIARTWTRGLEHLVRCDDRHSPAASCFSTASLQVFTMVRDPTARYVSYVHYWRRTYPHWKDLATPAERDRMVRGDVPGFLHLQSTHPALTLNSASQHAYFSPDDVDAAMAMVTDVPLRVLPLVHECFELSLELLSVVFPTLSIVPHTIHNVSSAPVQAPFQDSPETAVLFDEIQSYSMDELRHHARQWLGPEYRFYDAAVAQFRHLLRVHRAKLDPAQVLECDRRLDHRGAV